MAYFNDLTDRRFGKLKVVSRVKGNDKYGKARWLCKCDCGGESVVVSSALLSGHTKSCRCISPTAVKGVERVVTNKIKKTFDRRLFIIWKSMQMEARKSFYPSSMYGAICKSWALSFGRFRTWSYKNGYTENMVLSRYKDKGIYSPTNCCWVTSGE